jgi:hypothetical protein
MDLKELGLTKKKAQELVIDRIVDSLMHRKSYDDDDFEYQGESDFAKGLKKLVREQITKQVESIGKKHVLPGVKKMVDDAVMQETNTWGEKVGKAATFKEYLVEKAEAWLAEVVDFRGNPKTACDSYWRGNSTRVMYLIDSHMQYQIESAMKEALKKFDKSVGKGLTAAIHSQFAKMATAVNATIERKAPK